MKMTNKNTTILNKIKELYKKHSVRLDNMREWYNIQILESRVLRELEDIIKEYEKEKENEIKKRISR